MPDRVLSHLSALEAESIHILREVAAEFERPVMLYSIGKDSSVMVRLAQKAFHPGPIPFPLLHIDTTYKFQEMIEFRDRFCEEIGVKLIVHTNRQAIDEGASPFRLGTQKCCGLRGQLRCRLRRRAPRRREIARQGTCLQLPRRFRTVGPQESASRTLEPVQQPPR